MNTPAKIDAGCPCGLLAFARDFTLVRQEGVGIPEHLVDGPEGGGARGKARPAPAIWHTSGLNSHAA